MTVRREIAKPRRQTGARSPEGLRRTRGVRRGSEEQARRPQACRTIGSATSRLAESDNCSRRVTN